MLKTIDRVLAPLSLVAALLVLVLLFAGPDLIGAKKELSAGAAPTATPGAVGGATPDATQAAGASDGKQVFADAGCGGCHTLADAGSNGTTGPNLDDAKPDANTVQQFVSSGAGVMPSFKGQLSDAEIQAVAAYVSSAAGQ